MCAMQSLSTSERVSCKNEKVDFAKKVRMEKRNQDGLVQCVWQKLTGKHNSKKYAILCV